MRKLEDPQRRADFLRDLYLILQLPNKKFIQEFFGFTVDPDCNICIITVCFRFTRDSYDK